MPNFYIWRPADSVETVECWQAALEREHSPSILALTRQGLPALRTTHVAENLCARGGYEISPASGQAEVSIFASGSEVSLAVAAQAQLKEKGVAARVVSLPCFPVFFEQPEDYRRSVIGSAKVKVGVEAAVRFGWDAIIGDGPFIGMKSFGEAGPIRPSTSISASRRRPWSRRRSAGFAPDTGQISGLFPLGSAALLRFPRWFAEMIARGKT